MFDSLVPNSIEKRKAFNALQKSGAAVDRLPLSDINFLTTLRGSRVRCGDDRYGVTEAGIRDIDLIPKGPACFGGLEGFAAFIELPTWNERMDYGIKAVKQLGFTPAIHYDVHKDELGCLFRLGLLEGLIPYAPKVPKMELLQLHGHPEIEIDMLNGHHTGGAIVLNFENNTTVATEGNFYVVDLWPLRGLGIGIQRIADVTTRVGQLLFNTEHPKIYIPKFD